MEVQELENKIKSLETRLARLEKIENKRKTTKLIKLFIKTIIIITVLIGIWIWYNHVNESYIKPYKEIIEQIKENYDNIKSNNFSLDNILGKNKDKE